MYIITDIITDSLFSILFIILPNHRFGMGAFRTMTGLAAEPMRGVRGPCEYVPLTEDQTLPDHSVHESVIPRSDIGRRPAVVRCKKQLKRCLQPKPQNFV